MSPRSPLLLGSPAGGPLETLAVGGGGAGGAPDIPGGGGGGGGAGGAPIDGMGGGGGAPVDGMGGGGGGAATGGPSESSKPPGICGSAARGDVSA